MREQNSKPSIKPTDLPVVDRVIQHVIEHIKHVTVFGIVSFELITACAIFLVASLQFEWLAEFMFSLLLVGFSASASSLYFFKSKGTLARILDVFLDLFFGPFSSIIKKHLSEDSKEKLAQRLAASLKILSICGMFFCLTLVLLMRAGTSHQVQIVYVPAKVVETVTAPATISAAILPTISPTLTLVAPTPVVFLASPVTIPMTLSPLLIVSPSITTPLYVASQQGISTAFSIIDPIN